jgi:2-polyprenyl-3-methyl-5-hydroxy-6-metoxy-1,4-benzoquinol methylase
MRLPGPQPDPDYTYVREHDLREWWRPSIQPHAALGYQQRIRLLLEQIQKYVPAEASILDVGCAQGTAGLLLAEDGYQVTLLDLREAHVRYARDRYERGRVQFLVGRLSEAVPPAATYDAIICTEVLEHVPKPALLLEEIASRLKPGGLVFLTTPNADYLMSRLPSYGAAGDEVIEASEADSCDGDAHRYLFTREELCALIRGVGFRAEEVEYALPFWTQGHLKTRHLITLYNRATGRLPPLSGPTVLKGRVARRFSVFLVARARRS